MGASWAATVAYMPGSEGDLVILKPCWYADNGYETAVFPTKNQAVAFAWKRWRIGPDRIKVIPPKALPA